MASLYRQDLDLLKGWAIVAVISYHLSLFEPGYLGVDVFFVINGFLLIPSVIRQMGAGTFSAPTFACRRLGRLLPLVVIVSGISLVAGSFTMLPDDFENLSQTVIASCCCMENVLADITTHNYWISENCYKPLMHFWYVGALVQVYALLAAAMWAVRAACRNRRDHVVNASWSLLAGMTLLSLVLYLCPGIPFSEKFYLPQYRFFEFGMGGMAALAAQWLRERYPVKDFSPWSYVGIIGMACCFAFSLSPLTDGAAAIVIGDRGAGDASILTLRLYLLLLTVGSVALYLALSSGQQSAKWWQPLCRVGKMSFSLFAVHQCIIAFVRYTSSGWHTPPVLLATVAAIALLSWAAHRWLETPLQRSRHGLTYACAGAALIMVPSAVVYMRSGVIRDVPELGITSDNVRRGMFAEYCDRIYQYTDFTPSDHPVKVLIVGSSFARDFANVLLASSWSDSVSIAYATDWDDEGTMAKVRRSDRIFAFASRTDVPDSIWQNIAPACKIYGVGTKNFGACNGVSYVRRHHIDKRSYTTDILTGYADLNDRWREDWTDSCYVDLLRLADAHDGQIRVFTDDGRYISQDCRHLTPDGARWYAERIKWENYLTNTK